MRNGNTRAIPHIRCLFSGLVGIRRLSSFWVLARFANFCA
jgi:hypothetical protein